MIPIIVNDDTRSVKEKKKIKTYLDEIKTIKIDCSKYGNSKAKITRGRYVISKC